jgi:hypothetical protein
MKPVEFVLDHPSGLRIQKDLRESDVRDVPGVTTRDHRNGYVWYYLPQAPIAGQEIWMGLCFFGHRLDLIHLSVISELYGISFGDWSGEKERARVVAIRKWFADVGYPVGTYSWGVVGAETVMKTGDGSGIVRFTRAPG